MKNSFDFRKHQLTKLSKRFLVRIIFYAIVIGVVVYYTLFLTHRVNSVPGTDQIEAIEGVETVID